MRRSPERVATARTVGLQRGVARHTRLPLPSGEGWGEGVGENPVAHRRFMESDHDSRISHGGHEPWSEEDRKRPSSRPSPGGRRGMRPAGFEGMGR